MCDQDKNLDDIEYKIDCLKTNFDTIHDKIKGKLYKKQI